MSTNTTKRSGEIRYFAQANKLTTPNAPAFLPRAIRAGTADQDQVLDYLTQEGTTVTRAESLAVFNGVVKAIGHFLSLGYHVKLPFAEFRPTVKGRIEAKDPAVSGAGSLQAGVSVSPGSAIRGILQGVSILSVDQKLLTMKVFSFLNMRDQSRTGLLAGDLCTVSGQYLAFDPVEAGDGVFFVSVADQTEHRVMEYAHTGNRSVAFKAPADLKAGSYNLVVRSGAGKGKPLSGVLDVPLEVK